MSPVGFQPGCSAPIARRQLLRSFASALLVGSIGLWATTPAAAQAATPASGDWPAVQPGSIVLFRHATAPGTGDPPGFKLGDCSTQRNLDDVGRAQAKRIGEQFRERKLRVGQVLTSQWCRTRDTAELAFPGAWAEDASFNSFFEDRSRSDPQTAAALKTLSGWKGPGVLVVVTHQVNITALTGIVPSSGEGVVVRPKHRGGIDVVGRVMP